MNAHKTLKRPLLGFVLAVLGGIALAEFFPVPGWLWIAVAPAAGAAVWRLAARLDERRRAAALAILGLLAGAALQAAAAAERDRDIPALTRVPDGTLVRVRAVVRESASPLHPAGSVGGGDGRALGRVPSASLRVDLVAIHSGTEWASAAGAPARLVIGRGVPACLPGTGVEALATLVHPRPPGNPGSPSPQELRRAAKARCLLLVPCAEALRPIEAGTQGPAGRLVRASAWLRAAIERRLGETLAPRDAGLLGGLLLGDRTAVSESDRRAFERSGTLHILSVSGLHVVLVLAAWAALLGRSGVPRRSRIAALAVVALLYVAIAGFRTPVTRAALMAGTALLALGAGRRLDGWSALAAAALVLVCVDPPACFRAGWQLSFTAVAALLLAAGPLTQRLSRPEAPRWWAPLAAGGAASATATAGTAPLTWLHFGTIAPAALLANFVAVPLLALLLVGGLCLIPLLLAGGPAADAAALLLSGGCGLLRLAVELFARLPGGWMVLPPIGAATAVWLLAAGWWLASGSAAARPRITLGLGLAAAVWLCGPGGADAQRRHWVLDVGQGSATLLRTPAGQRILVDAGSSSLPYGGARELRRALAATGTGHIDLLVLSHGDADHINAVLPLVRDFGVSAVWAAPELEERGGGRRLLSRLRALGVPVRIVRDGAVARGLGAGTELRVLHPGPERRLRGNEGSLVVRYAEPGGAVLIPGDIEERGTADLLARRKEALGCDLLVAPHHGGTNARLAALLRHAAPRRLVISAGRRFPVGHTMAEAARRALPVHHTAASGAVAFSFQPNLILKAERPPGR